MNPNEKGKFCKENLKRQKKNIIAVKGKAQVSKILLKVYKRNNGE